MRVPQFGIFAQGTVAHDFIEFDLRRDVDEAYAGRLIAQLQQPAVSAAESILWSHSVPSFGGASRRMRLRPTSARSARSSGWMDGVRRRPSTMSGYGSAEA